MYCLAWSLSFLALTTYISTISSLVQQKPHMIRPREKHVHFCIHALEMDSIIRKHCRKLRESLVKKPYKYKKYYMFYLSICCNWKYIYLGTFEAVCWWFYDLVTFSFIFRHSVTFLRGRFWWLSLHLLYPLFVVSVYTQVHLLGSVVWVVSFCNSILFFLSCLACFSSVSQVLGFACLSLVLSVCVSFSFI